MTLATLATAALLSFGSWPTTLAQHKTPTEAQCKQMVEQMLATMRNTPLKEGEKADHRQFMAKVEKALADSRARGGGHCDDWAVIAKMVTTG